jgi:hypothetical protein
LGGLALLYPWLGAYLGTPPGVLAAAPGIDPEAAARAHALRSLVGPYPGAAHKDDPLLLILAGIDPAWSVLGIPDMEAAEPAALDAATTALLRSLAAVLRGFEAAPADYLRQHFLVRPGTLDAATGSVIRIRLEPAALDPVIRRLPYPLSGFRLPWTPSFTLAIGLGNA